MELGTTINEGTILVLTDYQVSSCGIMYLRKGSIVKLAREKTDWKNTVKVYRNISNEQEDNYYFADLTKVREATVDEIRMWDNGIYFITPN